MGLEDDVRMKLNGLRTAATDMQRGEEVPPSRLGAALLDLAEQVALIAQGVEDLQETT